MLWYRKIRPSMCYCVSPVLLSLIHLTPSQEYKLENWTTDLASCDPHPTVKAQPLPELSISAPKVTHFLVNYRLLVILECHGLQLYTHWGADQASVDSASPWSHGWSWFNSVGFKTKITTKQQGKCHGCGKRTCTEERDSMGRRKLQQGIENLRGIHNHQNEHSIFMKLPKNTLNKSLKCLYEIIRFLKYCFIV